MNERILHYQAARERKRLAHTADMITESLMGKSRETLSQIAQNNPGMGQITDLDKMLKEVAEVVKNPELAGDVRYFSSYFRNVRSVGAKDLLTSILISRCETQIQQDPRFDASGIFDDILKGLNISLSNDRSLDQIEELNKLTLKSVVTAVLTDKIKLVSQE